MTDKELKKLNRRDLLAILVEQAKEIERLNGLVEEYEKNGVPSKLAFSDPGNLAQEALRISGIFADAQKAADLYLQEIARMKEELSQGYDGAPVQAETEGKTIPEKAEKERKEILAQAEIERKGILTQALKEKEEILAQAQKEADRRLAEADKFVIDKKKQLAQYVRYVNQKVDSYYEQHPEIKKHIEQ